MQHLTLGPQLVSHVTALVDDVPKDEDVTAGWVALVIFVLLIAAVAFLGFSLVKQLRKAQAAEDAGLYDHDEKRAPGSSEQPEKPEKPADNNTP